MQQRSKKLDDEDIQNVENRVRDGIAGYEDYLKENGFGDSTLAANQYADKVKAEVVEKTGDEVAGEIARQAIVAAVQPKEYLVRGAILKCDCGSHTRKLNLPQCHGLHMNELPAMHQKDCVPDTHVMSFGICSNALRIEEAEQNGEDKVLYKAQADESKNVKGYVCKLKLLAAGEEVEEQELDNAIVGFAKKTFANPFKRLIGQYKEVELAKGSPSPSWNAPKEDGFVMKRRLITSESWLQCAYGGIIRPISSGQEQK